MMTVLIMVTKKAAIVLLLLFPVAISKCGGSSPGGETPQNTNPPWDTDGDSISNAVELNSANSLHNFDTSQVDTDPSIARGRPNDGWIDCAINLVDNGTGYWHNRGGDPVDTDDWGVLVLVNMIEGAGRDWYSLGLTPPRITVNDLSWGNASTQQFGGYFSPHACHQNGLEVDVRYVRKDDQELGLNIAGADSAQYDTVATSKLINRLLTNGDVDSIFIDTIHAGIQGPMLRHASGHSDHFHVRILDPDGLDNKDLKKRNSREMKYGH